ncbi:MAG TPA: hypothetical protein VJ912_03650, partial [Candidatus Nanoarchaeia archaeon]|nr:hypothetical protein [Candidatus Nanoarchaeia archaeon]
AEIETYLNREIEMSNASGRSIYGLGAFGNPPCGDYLVLRDLKTNTEIKLEYLYNFQGKEPRIVLKEEKTKDDKIWEIAKRIARKNRIKRCWVHGPPAGKFVDDDS